MKGYRFLSFAKNMSRSIVKNVSGKFSQKISDHIKIFLRGRLKAFSKRVIQKTEKETGDLIGKKVANKIEKNNSETSIPEK